MRGTDNILASSPVFPTQLKQNDYPRRERTLSGSKIRYVANGSPRRSPPHTLEIRTSPIITTFNGDGYGTVSLSNTHGNSCSSAAFSSGPKKLENNAKISGGGPNINTNSHGGATFKQAYTMVESYSSAKLAPPLVGASVVDYEWRSLQDHRVWYTVQIYPCSITFPDKAGSERMLLIPRKSYKIFRKFEDMMDFATRLEHEFPWLKSGHDTALKTGLFVSVILRDRIVSPWPLFKARHSQFLTDAECEQRKRDMNHYLQQLFSLGSIISQSTLVAEFFGIWKTDLDVHLLRQEDRDPLALHCLVSHQFELADTSASASTMTRDIPTSTIESPRSSPAFWSCTSSTSTCLTAVTSLTVPSAASETIAVSTTPAPIAPRLAPAFANWASVLRPPPSPSPSQPQPQFTIPEVSTPLSLSSSSRETLSFQPWPSPPGSSYHSTDEEFNALNVASDSDEDNTFDGGLNSRLERCSRFYHDILAMSTVQNSIKKSTSLQDLRRPSRCQQDVSDSQSGGKGWLPSSCTGTASTAQRLGQVSKMPKPSFTQIGSSLTILSENVSAAEDSTFIVAHSKPGLVQQLGLPHPPSRSHIRDTIGSNSSPVAIPGSVVKAPAFSHSAHKSTSPLSISPVIIPQMHSSTPSRQERTCSSREGRRFARNVLHSSRTTGISSPIEKNSPETSRLMSPLEMASSSELSRSRTQLATIIPRSKSSRSQDGGFLSKSLPSTSIGLRSTTMIDRRAEVSTMPSVPSFVSWVDHRHIPHLQLPPSKTGRSAGDQPRNNSAPIALLPQTAVSLSKEPRHLSPLERQHQQRVKGPNNKRGNTEIRKIRPTSALAAAAAASTCLSIVSTSAPSPSPPTSSYFSFVCTNNNNNDGNYSFKYNNSSNNDSKSSINRPSSPLAAVTPARDSQPSSPIKTPVSILKNASYFHGGTDHKVSNGVTTKSFGKRGSGGIRQSDNNNYTVSQHNNSCTNDSLDSLDLPQDDHNQDRVVTSYFSSRGGLEDQERAAPAVPGPRKSSSRRDINIGSERSPTAPDQVSTSSSLITLPNYGPHRSPTPHPHPPQRRHSGTSGLAFPSSPSSFTQKKKKRDQDHKYHLDSAPVASSPSSFLSSSASLTRQPHQNQSPPTPERATSPISGSGFLSQHPGAFVATFKVVVDAERIVALQVLEADQDFQLSVPELRRRIQSKFARMDIPLPRDFELVWTAWHGQRVVLKNDEELYQAVGSSDNNKVTLRCEF